MSVGPRCSGGLCLQRKENKPWLATIASEFRRAHRHGQAAHRRGRSSLRRGQRRVRDQRRSGRRCARSPSATRVPEFKPVRLRISPSTDKHAVLRPTGYLPVAIGVLLADFAPIQAGGIELRSCNNPIERVPRRRGDAHSVRCGRRRLPKALRLPPPYMLTWPSPGCPGTLAPAQCIRQKPRRAGGAGQASGNQAWSSTIRNFSLVQLIARRERA